MTLAFAIAYPLADTRDPPGEGAQWPDIYPSAAINYSPSQNVGGLIISLACVLLSWAFAIRHAENAARLGHGHSTLNFLSMCFGIGGLCCGPLGVIAVPWHEYPGWHFFFAYGAFYGGAIYLCVETYLDHVRKERVPSAIRYTRIGIVAVGVVAMVSYWLAFGVVGGHHPDSSASTGAEASLEILCLGLLLAFVSSFAASQVGLSLQVSAALPDADARPVGGDGDAPTAATPLLSGGAKGEGYNAMAA